MAVYFPKGTRNRLTGLVEEEREIPGEGPGIIEARTVRFWCRHTKELKGSQVKKAESFVAHDCVQYLGDSRFVCLPLNGRPDWVVDGRVLRKRPFKNDYNNSEYLIERTGEKTFECNCQGWQTRARRGEIVPEGANCSHVLALFYMFKLRQFQPKRSVLEVHSGGYYAVDA